MKARVLDAKWEPKPGYVVKRVREKDGKASRATASTRPDLAVREVAGPPDRPQGDVLLKVKACGVCGSDIHMYETTRRGTSCTRAS